MPESQPVEGLFDNIKMLPKLAQYWPLLKHLSAVPEFWQLLKTGQFDKAGDLVEQVAKALGYSEIGVSIDDLFDAIGTKSLPDILKSTGEILITVSKLLSGSVTADVIRLPTFSGILPNNEMTHQQLCAAIDTLDLETAPMVSSSTPQPTENPMLIIGIAGLVIQGLKFIWEWKKSQK